MIIAADAVYFVFVQPKSWPLKKVLIVDDEEDILFLLKSYLSKRYEVATVLSCEHGLEIFYSFKPDLVLLDVNVGTSDGRVMCKTIKAQAEYRHIPVILISAHRDNLLEYANYGATSVMEKPFNFPKVLATIQSHLGK